MNNALDWASSMEVSKRKRSLPRGRHTQSSLPRISLANQTEAAARTEGGAEINLHSRHWISIKYFAIVLVWTLY